MECDGALTAPVRHGLRRKVCVRGRSQGGRGLVMVSGKLSLLWGVGAASLTGQHVS